MKEVKFSLLGKDYSVRPEFRKIAAIEEMCEKGTINILQDIADSKFKTTDLVRVLFCMVGDPRVTLDKIGNEVQGNSLHYVAPVAEFLAACNFGSEELAEDADETVGGTEKND